MISKHAAAMRPDASITLPEAVRWLDPPLTEEQLRAAVQDLFRLEPSGFRRTGAAGRPARTYPAGMLMRIHAAVTPLLHELGRGPG